MRAATALDLRRLFQLRAAVGRYGEMDAVGWWNTQGVLGARGKTVYKRGFPRTHFFARARVVSAVAQARSSSVYAASGIATLWSLPPVVERALAFEEQGWSSSGNGATWWSDLEAALADPPSENLLDWLSKLGLIGEETRQACSRTHPRPGGNSVSIPGPLSQSVLELLAAAHAHGSARNLVVPFVEDGLEDDIG